MALREIITLPHPTLRRKARKVTNFGPKLQTLIDDMVETLRDAPGVGLAAPQIDVPVRVIVIEFGHEEEVPLKLHVVINPEIQRLSKDTMLGVEGCLSMPLILGEVDRSVEATISGQNRRGQPVKLKTKGWLARIFQHEIDHLNGVMFIDKAEQVWKQDEESLLPEDS